MAFTRAWTVAVVVAAACAVLVAGSIAVDVFHKKCFFVSDSEREGEGGLLGITSGSPMQRLQVKTGIFQAK